VDVALKSMALVVAFAAAARSTWSPCGLSMLTSINPLAERGRGHRYGVTAAWFLLGALAGGATLGVAAAIAALLVAGLGLSTETSMAAAAMAAALAALGDAGALGVHFPILRRQVNERWLDELRGWLYGVGFGWQIGVGFATYVMTAAVLLSVVMAALSGSALFALLLGLLFGLLRGSAVLLSSRATSPGALRDLLRRLDGIDELTRRIVLLVELSVAVIAGAVVAPWLGVALGAVGSVGVLGGLRRAVPASR